MAEEAVDILLLWYSDSEPYVSMGVSIVSLFNCCTEFT